MKKNIKHVQLKECHNEIKHHTPLAVWQEETQPIKSPTGSAQSYCSGTQQHTVYFAMVTSKITISRHTSSDIVLACHLQKVNQMSYMECKLLLHSSIIGVGWRRGC